MTKAARIAGLIAAAMLIFGAARAAEPDTMAPEARAELAAAIDLLKTHHINRASVDWPSLEAELTFMSYYS